MHLLGLKDQNLVVKGQGLNINLTISAALDEPNQIENKRPDWTQLFVNVRKSERDRQTGCHLSNVQKDVDAAPQPHLLPSGLTHSLINRN